MGESIAADLADLQVGAAGGSGRARTAETASRRQLGGLRVAEDMLPVCESTGCSNLCRTCCSWLLTGSERRAFSIGSRLFLG